MSQVAVCFVCLGNICRSPTAEGVFRSLVVEAGLSDAIKVESAGTAAYHVGEPADERSAAVASGRGYQLTSRARRFDAEDFAKFDYVLAMDAQNLSDLQSLRDECSEALTPGRPHLGLFRDFDSSVQPGSSVPDPYYGGSRGFDEVLDMCERACEGLLLHLRRTHGI